MKNKISQYLKYIVPVAVFIFVIFSCFFDGFLNNLSYTITITTLLWGLYEKFLWRFNPLEKTPKLFKKYYGKLLYDNENKNEKKEIEVFITQTLFCINIILRSDEIESKTIVGAIVDEYEQKVLYYNYITDPKTGYSQNNPIQKGTCRLVIKDKKRLEGNYWTTRKTTGDIILFR